MKRIPVDSSSIAEIGYDPRRRVLEVLFRNGGLYRYFGVSRHAHRDLLAADSIGRHMNFRIKGRYRYSRVAGARSGTREPGNSFPRTRKLRRVRRKA